MKSKTRQRSLRLAIAAAIAVGSAGVAFNSLAATDTDNLLVTADVTATCAITTAPVAFGSYDPTDLTDLNGTGTVTLFCTNGTAGYVTLGQGVNPDTGSSDDVPVRQMAGGAGGTGRLTYHLYSENTRTTVWGNTGTTGLDDAGDGTSHDLTVYGQIPARQSTATAGTGVTAYSDTVVATVTF